MQSSKEKLGIFLYNKEGFSISLQNGISIIKWSCIEKVFAYKTDLLTTDEICLDIIYKDKTITITEETTGWTIFLEYMTKHLKLKNNAWLHTVSLPPFETNLILVYEK